MRRITSRLGQICTLVWMLGYAPTGAAESMPSVRFSVLTYNIHGLSEWIAGDAPRTRIPLLLEKAQAFDLVLLQEDFAHQDLVDQWHGHRFLVRGTPGGDHWFASEGDGLTQLSNLRPINEAMRISFAVCHGWVSAASDCFANKGAVAQRYDLGQGMFVDVWTTHLDAGRSEADDAVRRQQLELLASAMTARGKKDALVIGGDFNLNWSDSRDHQLLMDWMAKLGLQLAACACEHDEPKQLDYVLYRPAANSAMKVIHQAVRVEFVDAQQQPLSDHPAISATFELSSMPLAP